MAVNMFAEALFAQSACNLGALVHALDRIITALQDHAHQRGLGTDWVNQHPVVRLYVEQLAHLSRRRPYSRAFDICRERAGDEAPSPDVPNVEKGT